MITDNQDITRPDYWNKIYLGQNDNAKVDASNTKRPPGTFDRFNWVAGYVEGPLVLGVASGHAHIEKRVKALHKDWIVVASDQATAAIGVARYAPYWTLDAYKLPLWVPEGADDRYAGEKWNTVVIAQALEYLADDRAFVAHAKTVTRCLVACLPLGEMEKWSQLRIYTEAGACDLFEEFGHIQTTERKGDLFLVKTRFYV